MAEVTSVKLGIFAPNKSPKPIFTQPATRPLLPAMKSASDAETLRVRLLSMAHAKQAPTKASGPRNEAEEAPLGHAKTSPPTTINSMPVTIRRSVLSRNTNHASTAVSTDSRFKNKDAVEAVVCARPTIRRSGPSTPPKAIAPKSQGHSWLSKPLGLKPLSRSKRTKAKPKPLPKYNRPANINGDVAAKPVPINCLANGVLAPNKKAAPSAGQAARCSALMTAPFGTYGQCTVGLNPRACSAVVLHGLYFASWLFLLTSPNGCGVRAGLRFPWPPALSKYRRHPLLVRFGIAPAASSIAVLSWSILESAH